MLTGDGRRAIRGVRALLGAAALASLAFALREPAFRRPWDGSLLPAGWTAIVSAAALGLVAAAAATRWQRAGLYFALALVGQSAALALIDSPNYNVLERHAPWAQLLVLPRAALLAAPAAQTLIGLLAVRSLWRRLRPREHGLTTGRWLIATFVMVAIAANGSFEPARYLGDLILGVWVMAANLTNLMLVASAIPRDAFRAASVALDRSARWVPVLCATWVVVAASAIAWFVFERTPIIPDAVSYLFQAKYFSAGRVFLPTPPELPAFDFEKFHSDGSHWWAYGFPGWPAVLSVGVRLGAPWLVNPVVAGVTVVMVYALLARMYDPAFARRATLLLSVSPWFLFMSASHMAHAVSLAWVIAALLALELARRSGRRAWAALGGMALGAVFLTRPLEALLAAPAFGLLLLGVTGTGRRWKDLAAFAAGGACVAALSFPYNAAVTGNALRTPHAVYADAQSYPGADRLGFGPEVGNLGWTHLDPLPGHGPADVLLNAHMNAYMVNVDLFGWSFGSVLLLVAFLLLGQWRRQDRLFLALIACITLGHGVYWFSGGPDIGARYWYQILVPLVVLTVRGAQNLAAPRPQSPVGGGAAIESSGKRGSAANGAGLGRVGAFVAAASVAALLVFVPWRCVGKYHDYRGMNDDLGRLARRVDFGRAVVFVREATPADYPRALILNPPGFRGPGPIFARDLGPDSRTRILRHFNDRPYWIVQGPAGPGDPFVVLEGPVAPQ